MRRVGHRQIPFVKPPGNPAMPPGTYTLDPSALCDMLPHKLPRRTAAKPAREVRLRYNEFAAICKAVIRLALYQPDIPQNAGALLRLGACLGVPVDIIEPCGFVIGERGFRRAGMDYLDAADWQRHASWQAFRSRRPQGRLVLLTTAAAERYDRFRFAAGDTLLVGRESAGVPADVHDAATARLRIPMRAGMRSLNVALAAAMAVGEALRQLDAFPGET
jgi:tRNA (cytidine/uridine-2'-O-)-methyltransferase